MPSPIAHLAAGYAIAQSMTRRYPENTSRSQSAGRELLAIAALCSLLPDVDSAVGILAGDFGRYHNNATHSLFVGGIVALGVGLLMRWQRLGQGWFWFVVALLSYELHVLMDSATISRGVMAFWPITAERFLAPVTIFYGLHWSDGLASWRHLWTFVTESAFAVVVVSLVHLLPRIWHRAS